MVYGRREDGVWRVDEWWKNGGKMVEGMMKRMVEKW